MVDFTSSLYLGMQHTSPLTPRITTGVPSALFESVPAKRLAAAVAQVQGLGGGFAAPSTLHIYHDLYDLLSRQNIIVFIDEHAYPVSKYGIEKLLLSKIAVHTFRHFDAMHLQELVKATTTKSKIPVVITDGWCPLCGRPAPLNVYANIVAAFNGNIVVDDTQAFGILGKQDGNTKYGQEGTGLLQWLNVSYKGIVSIVSMAKAFGVPVAVISGSQSWMERFKDNSKTAMYSSPVSLVHADAGLLALQANKNNGNAIREKLYSNILFFRSILKKQGMHLPANIFPVQSIRFKTREYAIAAHEYLAKKGIGTVLMAGHANNSAVLGLVIRSNHSANELRFAAMAIIKCRGWKQILQKERQHTVFLF